MAKPKDDLATYRKRLKDSRDELWRMIENTAESRAPVELDQTRQGRLSRMDAIQQQAMATETDRRRHQELTRINGALGRMAEGDYGVCVSCGEDVGQKRLELDPATPLCIDCASGA